MFNRKKNRIAELEMLLEAEKWSRELQEDSKSSYMTAIHTALVKDVITVEQSKQIMDLQNKYFDILRNYKRGA